jgi:DNA replication licensing factor MCM2
VNLEAVRRYIRYHFVKFLTHFVSEGRLIYHDRLAEMCHLNLQSLEVDFEHFRMANSRMAKWLAYSPVYFIPELNAVLYSYACRAYPQYQRLFSECYTKITNLPLCDSIRRLSH